MTRIVASGVHAGVIALLLSGAGCGGGGMEEGLPQDTTPVVPLNSVSAEMKSTKAPPAAADKDAAKPGGTAEKK